MKTLDKQRQYQSQVYDFDIAGVPYKLKTNHDQETVREMVEVINEKMNQSMKLTKNGSFQNAAVLTSMNLVEELLVMKKRFRQELESLEKKALRLSVDLENSKIQK